MVTRSASTISRMEDVQSAIGMALFRSTSMKSSAPREKGGRIYFYSEK
jgi:hypothetical protein